MPNAVVSKPPYQPSEHNCIVSTVSFNADSLRPCAAAVAYGVIAAINYRNRRNRMLALEDREIQAQAEYVSGLGCKDLGDLTNAVRLLERALIDGYRPAH